VHGRDAHAWSLAVLRIEGRRGGGILLRVIIFSFFLADWLAVVYLVI
jgi:hypothetical protein